MCYVIVIRGKISRRLWCVTLDFTTSFITLFTISGKAVLVNTDFSLPVINVFSSSKKHFYGLPLDKMGKHVNMSSGDFCVMFLCFFQLCVWFCKSNKGEERQSVREFKVVLIIGKAM